MLTISIVALSLVCVILIQTFRGLNSESPQEFKRRARAGDINSAKVYKTVSNFNTEPQLLVGLILIFTLSFISRLVIINNGLFKGVVILFIVYALITLFGFFGQGSIKIVGLISPLFNFILGFMGPILKNPSKILNKHIKIGPSKSISSKEELVSLLSGQSAEQYLSDQQRKTTIGALTYADKKVVDVMVPIGVVKTIKADEELSPIVINELHDSGYSRFPVVSTGNNVVGILFMRDAAHIKTNKRVSDVMHTNVHYINEDQALQDALKAFLKTKNHLLVVVNSYEDVVGILTIEDVIEQIIGEKIIDEFDLYDDIKAMAQQLANKKHQERG